jgi:predicted metal-dependent hydrolase
VHRIILGSYDRTKGRIEINDRLDRWYVPEYVLLDVIRHELLHRLVGWTSRDDQHGPVFMRAERSFGSHGRAEAWIERNQHRLFRG